MQNHWTVDMIFEEDDRHTSCTAVLTGVGAPELRGHGYARRSPADQPDTRIGEEVAASRACSNLAHELLEQAAGVIEAHTQRPAHLTG